MRGPTPKEAFFKLNKAAAASDEVEEVETIEVLTGSLSKSWRLVMAKKKQDKSRNRQIAQVRANKLTAEIMDRHLVIRPLAMHVSSVLHV